MRCVPRALVLSVVVLGMAAVSSGQILYDDFDSYPVGSPPGSPWGAFGVDGTIEIDDTVYNGSSGRSVSLDRDVFPGQPFGFGRSVPPLDGQAVVMYSFRITGSSREVLTVFAADDGNAFGPWVSVGMPFSGVWVYSDSLQWLWVSGVQINPDTWYRVVLAMDVAANTYDIIVWQEDNPTNTGNLPAVPFRTAAGVGPLTSIVFGDFNISVTPDNDVAWVDDVWVVPVVFGDSFENGDTSSWSQVLP